ncbi:MAG: hypothetical protein ACP5HU_05060 [Phycisphaerae bacterium]
MAIPTGTTARQISVPARLLPAAVVVLGVLTWWWPGYRAWGAMSAGMVLSLTLWVLWRIVDGRRTVPGHPLHWVLLLPAAMGLYHLLRLSWDTSVVTAGLGGAMSVTMLFQLALLGVGLMLTQSAFSCSKAPTAAATLFSLVVCLGAAAAAAWAPAGLPRAPMALLACAGAISVTGALSPLAERESPAAAERWTATAVLAGCGVLLVSVCVLAAKVHSESLPMTAAVLGGCMIVSLLRGRRLRVFALLAAAAAVAVLAVWMAVEAGGSEDPGALLLGTGEAGLLEADVRSSGLDLLIAWVGAPVTWCGIIGAGLAGLWLLSFRLPSRAARMRAACWTAAAGLSLAALLSAGGPFIPAVTLATAAFWGLLPAMCGAPVAPRSGLWLLGVLVGLLLVLGLSQGSGLVGWSASALGGSDRVLHAVGGFLLALVPAWLLGSRNVRLGVLAIALAALAGPAGEMLQMLVPGRGASLESWSAVIGGTAGPEAHRSVMAQIDDVVLHAVGSALVLVLYLPAMGARWCESPDAAPGRRANPSGSKPADGA